jgi:hypothetical protein
MVSLVGPTGTSSFPMCFMCVLRKKELWAIDHILTFVFELMSKNHYQGKGPMEVLNFTFFTKRVYEKQYNTSIETHILVLQRMTETTRSGHFHHSSI